MGKEGEKGGGWTLGGTWIPGGGPGLAVAGMSSGKDAGPRSRGKDPDLQVEAAGMRRVGVKQLLGREAFERAAARGQVWRGLGAVGVPRGRHSLLEPP